MTPMPMLGSPLATPDARRRLPAARPDAPTASSRGALLLTLGHFLILSLTVAAMVAIFPPSRDIGEDARNVGFGGGLVALASALLGRFRPAWAHYAAPVFAVSGGVFLAGLSIAMEVRLPGIAVQTVALTGLVFMLVALLYSTGLIRISERFKALVFTAIGAVGLLYLGAYLLRVTGVEVAFIHGAGIGAALWHGAIATLASANLLIDFQRLDSLDRTQLDRVADWHAALAVMTSFVWLYISILRMLQAVRR